MEHVGEHFVEDFWSYEDEVPYVDIYPFSAVLCSMYFLAYVQIDSYNYPAGFAFDSDHLCIIKMLNAM